MPQQHRGQGFPTSWDEFFAIKRKTIDKMNKRTHNRGGKRHRKGIQTKSKPINTITNDPWDIRLVVHGNGGVTLCGSRILKRGKWAAATHENAGASDLFTIMIDTLELSDGGRDTVSWRYRAITKASALRVANNPPPRPSISLHGIQDPSERCEKMVAELKRWCRENSGVAVLIGRSGSRGTSLHTEEHFLLSGPRPMRMEGISDGCIPSAILNASQILLNEQTAGKAKQDMSNAVSRASARNEKLRMNEGKSVAADMASLKVLNDISAELRLPLEIRKFRLLEELNKRNIDPFEWICNMTCSVYVVRLVEHGVVDHTVLVVTSETKCILDPEEQNALKLDPEVLRKCGGHESTKLRIAEVREILDPRKN